MKCNTCHKPILDNQNVIHIKVFGTNNLPICDIHYECHIQDMSTLSERILQQIKEDVIGKLDESIEEAKENKK